MVKCVWFMVPTIYVTERSGKGGSLESLLFLNGTGPLACLSLFPVADLDKVSND